MLLFYRLTACFFLGCGIAAFFSLAASLSPQWLNFSIFLGASVLIAFGMLLATLYFMKEQLAEKFPVLCILVVACFLSLVVGVSIYKW